LLGYVKALAGSNVVKVAPISGSASGLQATDKALRVVCGTHEGIIPNGAWIAEKKTPMSFCQVKVSPNNTVMPNVSGIELGEALARVIPFASNDKERPVLQSVKVSLKDGKLTLAGADGYRLAVASLDFGEGEGDVLIEASELAGLIGPLRKAKRIRLGLENGGKPALVLDTELIRYKWATGSGTYPNYEQLIPSEFTASASFDTKEANKANQSLANIWIGDSLKREYHPLILTIGQGKVVLEAKEERGKAIIEADTTGEAKIAVIGRYFTQALKACGGIVELKVSSPSSPMLFTVDGYRLVVMPYSLASIAEKPKAEAVAETEAVVEAVAEAKPKRKGKRKAKAKAEVEAVAETEGEAEAEPEPVAV